MSFENLSYLPVVLFFIIIIVFINRKIVKQFYEWVEDHWFFKPSNANRFSNILFVISLCLFAIALLDLRGPEKRIVGKVSDQRTIILVDSSASMLAEDVRPNRYQKSLLLVKHYIRKAVGQKIALNVFSDSQKTIVPFTDDYNLLKARVGLLETLELKRGGTALSLAIQESIQYFKNTSKDVVGNILIFTDAEETDGGLNLEIPSGISVAVVGVGTAKGGVIPMRDSRGVFKGNKKYNGETVISKLDEKFLESLGENIENYKYWVASSYSLPTEEIVSFFNRVFNLKMAKNDFVVKPVWANYLLIPGCICFILAMLLNFKASFVAAMLLLSFQSYSQDSGEKEPEKVKSPQTLYLEKKFIEGTLDQDGVMDLSASLLNDGFSKEAEALYKENLNESVNKDNLRDQFNLGTAELMNKKPVDAIRKYNNLLNYMEDHNIDDEILESELKKNLLKALKQTGGGKGKGKGKGEDDDKEDKSDSKSEGEGEGKEGQDNDKKQDSEKKDKKDQKKNDSGDNKDQKAEKDKKKNNKGETPDERKERKKKVPVLLKQLMSDDNQLQKKLIDAKTTKQRKSSQAKDW